MDNTSDDADTTAVIKRCHTKLFKKITTSLGHIDEVARAEQSHRDEDSIEALDTSVELLFAITVNVQPTRLMNKKQWRMYSHDLQEAQLTRIEQASRRKFAIDCIELRFETCPTLGNRHFHALYRMSYNTKLQLELYYDRIMGNIGYQKDPWRYLDISLIKDGDAKSWLEYIRKDCSVIFI